jgi:signal transduction histidine kinase
MNLTEVCMNVVDELRTSHPERIIDFNSFSREDLFGDDNRLAQVLSNIIGNALQYGAPHEPICVRMSSTEKDVSVTVNNKGPVIPPNSRRLPPARAPDDRSDNGRPWRPLQGPSSSIMAVSAN